MLINILDGSLYILIRGPAKQICVRKIDSICLPLSLNICVAAQKYRLSETTLLSTHNIRFG